MEIHRLKPMKEGYNMVLFNNLYKKTAKLRKKLTWQIDSRRLGVTKDEVESWFSDKFIFAFNKYYGEVTDDQLLGYIIKALQLFQCRILRKSYLPEMAIYQNSISIDDDGCYLIIPDKSEMKDKDLLINLAYAFLEKQLSPEAIEILKLEIQPPLYILDRVKNGKDIPMSLIIEFMGWEYTHKTIRYLKSLKEEIKVGIELAKSFYSTRELV